MAPRSDLPYPRRVVIALSIGALFAVAGLVSWLASQVLLTLFAGVLVGVLLRGIGLWVGPRLGVPYPIALSMVCATAVLLGLGFTVLLAASITQQFSEMFDQLPQAIEQLRTRIEGNPLGQRILSTTESVASEEAPGGAAQVVSAVSVAIGALGSGVLVLFVGLFLAVDPGIYRGGLVRLVPQARRGRAVDVLDEAGDVLLRWLLGRLLLMAVVGVLTWIGLTLMGVPLALSLAVLAGGLSFIPNLGPVISAVPAMLLAATEQPVMALYVAALYLGLQTAESYLLEPYVVRKTANLPAALVIAFQLLMGTLVGVMGLMLATPLLAMLAVLVERLYIEDILGDHREPDAA